MLRFLTHRTIDLPDFPARPERTRVVNETLKIGKNHRLRPDVELVAGIGLLRGRNAPKPVIEVADEGVTIGREDYPIHIRGGGGVCVSHHGACLSLVLHSTDDAKPGIYIPGPSQCGREINGITVQDSHFHDQGILIHGGIGHNIKRCVSYGPSPLLTVTTPLLSTIAAHVDMSRSANHLIVASGEKVGVSYCNCFSGHRKMLKFSNGATPINL